MTSLMRHILRQSISASRSRSACVGAGAAAGAAAIIPTPVAIVALIVLSFILYGPMAFNVISP